MLDEYGNAARTTTRTIEHLLFPFSPIFLPTCQPEQTNVRGQAGGGATGVGPPMLKSGWSRGVAAKEVRERKFCSYLILKNLEYTDLCLLFSSLPRLFQDLSGPTNVCHLAYGRFR